MFLKTCLTFWTTNKKQEKRKLKHNLCVLCTLLPHWFVEITQLPFVEDQLLKIPFPFSLVENSYSEHDFDVGLLLYMELNIATRAKYAFLRIHRRKIFVNSFIVNTFWDFVLFFGIHIYGYLNIHGYPHIWILKFTWISTYVDT